MKQKNQIIFWIALGFVAALSASWAQGHLGNGTTHFILEITGGFLALCTTLFAVNCTFERREGLTSYVLLGFLSAGLTDILRSLFAMGILLIPEASVEQFMSGTWTLGRTLPGAILLWGLIRTSKERGFRPSTPWLSLLIIVIVPLTIMLFTRLPLPSLIVTKLPLVHRPWEFVALLLYLACMLIILKGGERRNSRPLLPFLVLGILTQLIMAFSLKLFDLPFNMSHALKDISYLAAAVSFGILVFKRSRYSIEVSLIRQLVAGSIIFLLLSCSSIIALGLQRESALMINEHIDDVLVRLKTLTEHHIKNHVAENQITENQITENQLNEIRTMGKDRMKQTSYLLMGQLFVLIGFMPVLFIIAVAMTSRHLKHIISLTEMAKRIKNGMLHERAQIQTEDETGTLAAVFNDMLDSLEMSQKNLQEAHDSLEMQVAERTKEQQKLVELIRRSDEFIGMASLEGRMIFVNDAGIKLVGLDKLGKVLPETIFEYFFENDLTFMQEVILPAMIRKGLWKGEIRFRHFGDGAAIPVELSAFTIVSQETGDVLALAMVCRDISEIKEYQDNLGRMVEERTEELRRALHDAELSRDRIDGILRSVADGLIVTDRHNKIILMNRSAEDLLDVQSSELIGKPIECAIHDKTFQEKIEETISKKGNGHQFDFTLSRTDSEYPRYIRGHTSAIFDREGDRTGTVTIIYDVTHEVEIDRMKTEFISTAAHELRTPLTSIRGFSEILLTKKIAPEENRKFLTYINEQSIKLGNIINELLDISRIESGRGVTLNKAPFHMGEEINKVVHYFEGITRIHTFDIELSAEPVELYADSDKMEQVLKNILGNAVKYSPKGGHIKIKDKVVHGCYQVTVKDEGIGMTPEQVNRIFDKFYRADISDSAIEGTGLGMTIVRYIIDAHGGEVQIKSRYGKGTTVSFTLPLLVPYQDNKLKQSGPLI